MSCRFKFYYICVCNSCTSKPFDLVNEWCQNWTVWQACYLGTGSFVKSRLSLVKGHQYFIFCTQYSLINTSIQMLTSMASRYCLEAKCVFGLVEWLSIFSFEGSLIKETICKRRKNNPIIMWIIIETRQSKQCKTVRGPLGPWGGPMGTLIRGSHLCLRGSMGAKEGPLGLFPEHLRSPLAPKGVTWTPEGFHWAP